MAIVEVDRAPPLLSTSDSKSPVIHSLCKAFGLRYSRSVLLIKFAISDPAGAVSPTKQARPRSVGR